MLCVVDCKDVDTFCKVVYRNGYASVVAAGVSLFSAFLILGIG